MTLVLVNFENFIVTNCQNCVLYIHVCLITVKCLTTVKFEYESAFEYEVFAHLNKEGPKHDVRHNVHVPFGPVVDIQMVTNPKTSSCQICSGLGAFNGLGESS